MSIYVCPICGYEYDGQLGDPDHGIAPGTRWEDLPDTWTCPICGAEKADFVLKGGSFSEEGTESEAFSQSEHPDEDRDPQRELNAQELAALFDNLSKGCLKQYRTEEAGLFTELSAYYRARVAPMTGDLTDLLELARLDLETGFSQASKTAVAYSDRGALRALAWSEKVTRILVSILRKDSEAQKVPISDTRIFVCEVCGFIYIGDEVPEICPVCKVPGFKLTRMQGGV